MSPLLRIFVYNFFFHSLSVFEQTNYYVIYLSRKKNKEFIINAWWIIKHSLKIVQDPPKYVVIIAEKLIIAFIFPFFILQQVLVVLLVLVCSLYCKTEGSQTVIIK